MRRRIHNRRSGQIVVALAVMLLALATLALMNIDTFLMMRGKARMGNAGDAAALAAAHWQGVTLNLVGDLNLTRLDAICKYAEDPNAAHEISAGILALQERIAFAGPIMGLLAASEAAAMNHAGINSNMTEIVNKSIELASKLDVEGSASWPEQWSDYAEMLREARGEGLCVGCDNAQLFDLFSNFSDGHVLHRRAFYEAVKGKDWCWFFLRSGMYSLLRNFQSWPPLGEPLAINCDNPEYFGVGLQRGSIDTSALQNIIMQLAAAYDLQNVTTKVVEKLTDGLVNDLPWFLYDLSLWRTWTEMDPDGHDHLPILSAPKDEYNILGATAAVRAGTNVGLFTPNVSGKVHDLKDLDAGSFITEEGLEREEEDWMSAMRERRKSVWWTAAAKPFGCRESAIGREPVTQFAGIPFPLVTPDFTAVRLIPLAGASGGNMGTADASWVNHQREHLMPYMENQHKHPGCKWCSALAKWDNPEFRQSGVEWLKNNSGQCLRKGGGGHTPQGGTRHAH